MKIIDALDKGDLDLARNLLLQEVYDKVDDKNSWDSPNYTASELTKETQRNIILDSSRDKLLTFFGLQVLTDRYFLKDNEGNIVETPQKFFARVAAGLSENNQELAQNLYEIISNLWFMPATPILTNISTDRGALISCFLQYMGDSIKDIYKTVEECAFLGSGGGGLGVYMGDVRGQGAKIKKTMKSSGTIPFMKVLDSNTLAITQGGVRRASAATYLDISHPDCEEFINIRKPTGGDDNRKCLNLHHGVNITDKFMEAVKNKQPWDLICPHTKKVVKTIDAFTLWKKILTNRVEIGEPYILFIDTTNKAILPEHEKRGLFVKQSNLCCVTGDTYVLTDKGNIPISDLIDKEVSVWNGSQWSKVTPQYTGDKEIYKVSFSDGTYLKCSDNHKFHIQKGYTKSDKSKYKQCVELKELEVGDKLQKCNYPIIEFPADLEHPYTNGFFTGDGNVSNNRNIVRVYKNSGKLSCVSKLSLREEKPLEYEEYNTYRLVDGLKPKFFIPEKYSIKSKVEWLAGLFDSDGCISKNKDTDYLMYSSTNEGFIKKVSLLLQTLGVKSKVSLQRPQGTNIIKGKKVSTKPLYVLYITSGGLQALAKLGFNPQRLKYRVKDTKNNTQYFVKVESIEKLGFVDKTYCFNEPINNTAVFNGVYTGQSEITLPTDSERCAVCCLGSINLEQCPESLLSYVSGLATEALDNVLSIFIDKADKRNYKRAIYSASKERSIGLGLMGWHGYLMKNEIPFESITAIAKAATIQETIQKAAKLKSEELAIRKGECDDNPGYRNSYLTAIAPTANISVIAGGATPCIEPIAGNAYLQKTLSGSFLVKNKYLEKVLKNKGKNTEKVWSSIIKSKGSVQHLEFLTDEEKKLFKTGYELDQRFVIRQAAARQKHLCQSQSLNLFFGLVDGGLPAKYLNEVHMLAWELGVKSLYYLRSESVLGLRVDYDECSACQ